MYQEFYSNVTNIVFTKTLPICSCQIFVGMMGKNSTFLMKIDCRIIGKA